MRTKSQAINDWKKKGVISDDFHKLYEEYMSINNCQLCGVLFNKDIHNNKRCLDHDHQTGLYRQTICHKCNRYFDRKINKNNKFGHQYISIQKYKRKDTNKISATFVYCRWINGKRVIKKNISLTKLIAFSFIKILKYN